MISKIAAFLEVTPWAQATAGILLLGLAALAANMAVRRVLLRLLEKLLSLTDYGQDEELKRHNVISRVAHALPAAVVMYGIRAVPSLPASAVSVISNVASAYIILTFALALSTVYDAVNTVYARQAAATSRPIKGYLQILKIATFIVAGVLCLATLVDRSPLILLSGVGAMAAVLILVFQDTLLSFVATAQITSSQMLRVGDWVQIQKLEVDGTVIDIALHHITIRNWDMTLTTIPVRKFVSEPFKNWRGMLETGSRRIKRPLYLDQTTVRFLDNHGLAKLAKDPVLKSFMAETAVTLAKGLTNAGLFRLYLEWFLRADQRLDTEMRLMIRMMEPTPTGIPLEIYCFSRETEGMAYESLQSDIFEHALAVMSHFGLSVFQAR
jgi:miniconductance mechanosensitive channel